MRILICFIDSKFGITSIYWKNINMQVNTKNCLEINSVTEMKVTYTNIFLTIVFH